MTLTDTASSTSLVLEAVLDNLDTDTFFDMEVTTQPGDQEPCLIHNSCNYCETDKCDGFRSLYERNGTAVQNEIRYGTDLEYRCGLGMAFKINGTYGNETEEAQEMRCLWDGRWTPSSNLSECICKCKIARIRTL